MHDPGRQTAGKGRGWQAWFERADDLAGSPGAKPVEDKVREGAGGKGDRRSRPSNALSGGGKLAEGPLAAAGQIAQGDFVAAGLRNFTPAFVKHCWFHAITLVLHHFITPTFLSRHNLRPGHARTPCPPRPAP